MKVYRLNKIEQDLLETQRWCEEKFKDRPIYERRLPRANIKGIKAARKGETKTKEQIEINLGRRFVYFKQSEIYMKVEHGEELTEEEQRIYDLYIKLCNEYDISIQEANLLKVKEWCEEKFRNKPVYERRLPRTDIKGIRLIRGVKEETEEQKEVRLGKVLNQFRQSQTYKNGQIGSSLTESEQRIYNLYIELNNEYNINIQEANLLEVRAWCEEKYKGKPIYERRLPRTYIRGIKVAKEREKETEGQREVRLGIALVNFKQSTIYKKTQNKKALTPTEQKTYNLYLELNNEYNINTFEANLLEVKAWCEEKYKDKPIYERRLPRTYIRGIKVAKEREKETEEQREIRLRMRLTQFKQSEIFKKGQLGEELTEEEQRIYDLYVEINNEYNINTFEANLLEAKAWCEEKYKDKPIYERHLPRRTIKGVKLAKEREKETEEQREVRLGTVISRFKESKTFKKSQLGEKLTEEEKKTYDLYVSLQIDYGRGRHIKINWQGIGIDFGSNNHSITGQDIGKASFDADTKKCDEMSNVVESLVNEKKKQIEGEQK